MEISKTEHFKRLFAANDTARNIDENIEKMYRSAAAMGCKEIVADDAAKLLEIKNNLLKQWINFTAFTATLDLRENKVLELRCEKNMGWKQVSAELGIAVSIAKRIFDSVSQKAEMYGIFEVEK